MSRLRITAPLREALPFWMSLALVPILIVAARQGGWALALPLAFTFLLISLADRLAGPNPRNADPETPESRLFWHRLITLIWYPIQIAVIYGLIWYVTRTGHLNLFERLVLFHGVGMMSGAVGIVYAHELMHQNNRLERWLADLLMASVLYSHFRSEHLLVHHRHVGTPRDAATARYNENFHRFFARVLWQSRLSAFRAEAERRARRGIGFLDPRNPYLLYWTLQAAHLLLAALIGGWAGLGLFAFQALVAIWYLELTNYVEHYGLTRKHLGEGRYEPVRPHHSWNAAQTVSNWFLINLQRHSDHHVKPARRYPLLASYPPDEAPQLPHGYPLMVVAALFPRLWRRMMNPRVRRWRAMFYPEITDWTAYRTGNNPMPR